MSENIQKISSGLMNRGFRVASLIASATKAATEYKLLIKDPNSDEGRKAMMKLVRTQVIEMVKHFNQMKGGAMKLGQIFSMYGEVFLPAEVNNLLKGLQDRSLPFEYEILQETLMKELGPQKLEELDLERQALASASIGQVHRARIKSTGEEIVLKVQYPNVDQAIESDLRLFRSFLKVLELFPQISHLDLLFEEVASMLRQELDYEREAELTREYEARLKDDNRYVIPKVYDRYTTRRVLATSFEPGQPIDSPEVQALSQERRNRLAFHFLELYYNELFRWKMVQTDPHLGNYRIRINENGEDQFILYDYGAVRKLEDKFVEPYSRLVLGALHRDETYMLKAAKDLNFIIDTDPRELVDKFIGFCKSMVEPMVTDEDCPWFDEDKNYDWGNSDIPQRLTQQVSQVVGKYNLRVPPREVIFLDRKTGGVFILLAVLNAKMQARSLLENFLPTFEVDRLK